MNTNKLNSEKVMTLHDDCMTALSTCMDTMMTKGIIDMNVPREKLHKYNHSTESQNAYAYIQNLVLLTTNNDTPSAKEITLQFKDFKAKYDILSNYCMEVLREFLEFLGCTSPLNGYKNIFGYGSTYIRNGKIFQKLRKGITEVKFSPETHSAKELTEYALLVEKLLEAIRKNPELYNHCKQRYCGRAI